MQISIKIENASINYELNTVSFEEVVKLTVKSTLTFSIDGIIETKEISNTVQILEEKNIAFFRHQHNLSEINDYAK